MVPSAERGRGHGRRRLALGLAAAVLLLSTPVSARGEHQPAVVRLAGSTRWDTAAAVCAELWPLLDAEIVADCLPPETVVSSFRDFPDALAASGFAGAHHAAVLPPPTRVGGATGGIIYEDAGTSAWVVGGESAVGAAAVAPLERSPFPTTVHRLAGADRYATAAAIARQIGLDGIGTLDGARTAVLVSGETAADAIAAAPLAYVGGLPVLLATRTSVPDETLRAIADLGIDHVVIVGGTAALSSGVATSLRAAAGVSTERLAGSTRYGTSAAVVETLLDRLGTGTDELVLVSGEGFADALAAAPYAGLRGATMLLVGPTGDAAQEAVFARLRGRVRRLVVVGGPAAVPDPTVARVRTLLGARPDAVAAVDVRAGIERGARSAKVLYGTGEPGARVALWIDANPDTDADPTNDLTADDRPVDGVASSATVGADGRWRVSASPPGIGPDGEVEYDDSLVVVQTVDGVVAPRPERDTRGEIPVEGMQILGAIATNGGGAGVLDAGDAIVVDATHAIDEPLNDQPSARLGFPDGRVLVLTCLLTEVSCDIGDRDDALDADADGDATNDRDRLTMRITAATDHLIEQVGDGASTPIGTADVTLFSDASAAAGAEDRLALVGY